MGIEKGPEFYTGKGYLKKFDSNYKIYSEAWKMIPKYSKKIFDLGCGIGYFASILNKHYDYLGIDFSPIVIGIAKKAFPDMKFKVGSLLDESIYKLYKDDGIYIILEALEHIEKDIEVLQYIPKNSIVILSVPNRDFISHVRYFKTITEVKNRYSKVLKITDEKIIETNINKKAKVFMIKGTIL